MRRAVRKADGRRDLPSPSLAAIRCDRFLLESFSSRLGGMARPAQAFKVSVFISASVSLRLDVVHAGRLLHDSLPKVVLTQPFVTG